MAALVHSEQPLTTEEFEEFEQLLRRPSPKSFRDHYLAHNGGSPAEEDVEAGKWGLPVHGFYPIKYGSLTIESLLSDYGDIAPLNGKFGSWDKLSYIPFAYDAGGNPLLISLRDQDYGSVYIYAPDGDNIKKVSSSFEGFIERLYNSR